LTLIRLEAMTATIAATTVTTNAQPSCVQPAGVRVDRVSGARRASTNVAANRSLSAAIGCSQDAIVPAASGWTTSCTRLWSAGLMVTTGRGASVGAAACAAGVPPGEINA
jgi:hypothetical protein